MDGNNFNPEIRLTTKRLLIIVVSVQLALLGLISLDRLGLEIPILRQVIGFIYLTFVPGILILRIIKLDNKDIIETLLYSVGLSLSFLMFTGALINFLYPIIGIPRPISETPLVITISVIVLLLCFVVYLLDKEYSTSLSLSVEQILSPSVLSLCLLPFLAVFGAYLLSYYNSNFLLLILFAIISVIPILVAFGKIPNQLFTLITLIISISLLFSISLATKHLSYGDASVEYSYANLVLTNGIWDPSISGNHNAMLRIVMLHPIHSLLLNMELKDVFRIIHPLLYSFTPLALYMAFKRQTNKKIAFFSTFFFMSIFSFYVILSRNTRTGIAELFIALFILSLTDEDIARTGKSLLSVIFGLSIVVCHYGTSYLFMSALTASTLILTLIKFLRTEKSEVNSSTLLSPNFCVLYIVFCSGWYMYNSAGSSFQTLVNFGNHMIAGMSELFSPETSYTVYALSRDWPFSVEVSRNLVIVATIFVAIGIISLIWNTIKGEKTEFQPEFSALSLSFFGILLATLLPAKGFNPARVTHISLCFLAPFAVIGFTKLCNLLKLTFISNSARMKLFAVFLMIFLLFNSGFISEVLTRGNDYSPNVLISKPRASSIDEAQYIYAYRRDVIPDQEFYGAKWLVGTKEENIKIYLDPYTDVSFRQLTPPLSERAWVYPREGIEIKSGYIFLNYYNVHRKISIIQTYPPKKERIKNVYPLTTSNRIYTNGGSEIYYR